jgi:hypothetical protein
VDPLHADGRRLVQEAQVGVDVPLVSLERGMGVPGCGVFLLGERRLEDSSVLGARYFCLAFLPLVPLGRVRLIPSEGSRSRFELEEGARVPVAESLRRLSMTLGLAVVALAPGAFVLPRIHETGIVPGLRLVAAALLPLVVVTMADLRLGRLRQRKRVEVDHSTRREAGKVDVPAAGC